MCIPSASELLVDLEFAQYPLAGILKIISIRFYIGGVVNKLSGMCIRVFGLFFINPDSNFNRFFFFLKTTFLEVILSAELGIPFSSELHAFLSAVSGVSEWLTMLESAFSSFATTKKKSQDALFFRFIFPGASWGTF